MRKLKKPKILIAGVGNDLRQDDAFGIELVRLLSQRKNLPSNITIMEVGIGGIHLVQELQEGYDVLIILDAVDWEGKPGEIFLREAEVGDIQDLPLDEQRDFLADMHYTNPDRALMLAKAVNILPGRAYILGCKSEKHDDFEIGMSESVTDALPKAEKKLWEWIESLNKTVSS